MNPATALDPLALRVARRHLASVRTSDTGALAPAVSTARLAVEYQRRGEGLVPVGEEEADDEDGTLKKPQCVTYTGDGPNV